jgi:DNA-binding SARP family transcriptional activator
VEFRILGPLEVRSGGRRIEVARARPRALLATLLLSAGELVSTERLIDGIWGESAPASADQLVRVYVSQLRKLFGEEATIATRVPGYVLERGDGAIDARRFEELLAQARRARDDRRLPEAVAAYDQALGLWRGGLLADTPLEGEASVRAARLEALRLSALDERADALLELGRHLELIPELEQRVAAEPARERVHAQLMLALYRAGRQADALKVYRDARRYLAEELGLEPGPELRELERGILRQDPGLAAPARPGRERSRRRRGPAVTAGGAVVIAAALALGITLSRSGSQTGQPRSLPPQSVGALDAATGVVLAAVPIAMPHATGFGPPPSAILPATLAADDDHVWIADPARRTLSEIDPKRLRVLTTVGLPAIPYRLVSGGGALWIGNGFDGTLSRVSPDDVVSPPFRPEPHSIGRLALAYGAGSLWVGSQDNTLSRLDPLSERLIASVGGVMNPEAAAFGFHAVWIAQATRVDLLRIDTRTNRISARIPLGGLPKSVAAGAGAVWALTPAEGRLWRINPRTNAAVATIAIGENPTNVVTTENAIWVASQSSGILRRIDPHTNTVAQTVRLNHPLGGIAAAGNRLWVAVR